MNTVQVTIPANTPEASPLRLKFIAGGPLLYQSMVRYRKNCAFLAHLQVLHHGERIIPGPESTWPWVEGDEAPILFYYPGGKRLGDPYDMELVAWNEDDTYPRTVDVYLTIGA